MVANLFRKQKGGRQDHHFWLRAAAVCFIFFVAFLAFENIKIWRKGRGLAEKVNDYKKQIEQIKKDNEALKIEIANADNEDYIKKIAYEQLNQQRAGEQEYIFSTPQQEAPGQNPAGKNFWAGWLSGLWTWLFTLFR